MFGILLPAPASGDVSTRERILTAAEELFAESGFDATPTSRIAEIDHSHVVVPGDVTGSLRRLVAALDAWLDASPVLSHLLWREADTHDTVRNAGASHLVQPKSDVQGCGEPR